MKTLDINLAKTMSRWEWIATWVTYKTRTIEGRELVNGFLVKKVRGGWVYGFANSPAPCCHPTTAEKLCEMIRRNDLNYYVNEAEHLRIDLHLAA